MNSSIGVNIHKELNSLMRKVKMPKTAHRKYYTYMYEGEPSYKEYENDCCCDADDCCCSVSELDRTKKLIAVAGVGVVVGLLGICLLRKR